ncbi:MAG: hypothetical protein CEN89_103 [Candidatus Berkelbacteria bacterium Licking1014_7]|uniref:50S ribosomal protein L35 n=1 Tax=Candidatus Berkelbacteria bacterium Licking1014_7 TaxID=2017147 RepID=A0A554LKP3_9BACT|nr:MAG: hypothetical protein CEN89_103 [Candidatus Berkelbacteria bacterium Licking1014_7]
MKQKTYKSAAKRIKRTNPKNKKKAKIIRLYQSDQHRVKGKSKRSQNNAKRKVGVNTSDQKKLKKLI